MNVFSRVKKAKNNLVSKAKESYNESKRTKAELKKVYREEYKKARLEGEKLKAQNRVKLQVENARKDAAAGGRFKRIIKEGMETIKENKEKRLKVKVKGEVRSTDFKQPNQPPMFK